MMASRTPFLARPRAEPSTMCASMGQRASRAQAGHKVTPTPQPIVAAMMKRLRRFSAPGSCSRMCMPEARTLANRKVVMPPSTHEGMDWMNAPIFDRMPRMSSQMPQEIPTRRDATFVRLMIPLFWAKVVRGSTPERAAKMPLRVSFSSAPFWRMICSALPVTSSREASMEASVSAQVSQVVIKKTIRNGTFEEKEEGREEG